MNVDIKRMPELRTAAVRHIGSYSKIAAAFGRLHSILEQDRRLGERPTLVAIYHDDPEMTPESELRSDAAVVLPNDTVVPEGLRQERLPAGRYACATHVGAYEGLPDAWRELLGGWLPLSGERLGNGATFEIYRNTPEEVAKNELLTELYVPLA